MTEQNAKFKIDLNGLGSTTYPVAVFRKRRGFFCTRWDLVQTYETVEKAKAGLARIEQATAGLPIYR